MNPPQVVLGGVYESPSSPYPMRVVAFDDHVVMYDAWWPHKGEWGMSKLHGAFAYYRLERVYFEAHSRFLRSEPLSEQELQVHRPDLPFAFAQRSNLSWYTPWQRSDVLATKSSTASQPMLDTPAIFIAPFGPRDSSKPPVLVQAANGSSFSETELLLVARRAQEPFLGAVRLTSGVGIYRSGIKKRLPSFYLWGAISRLDSPPKNGLSMAMNGA